MDLAIFSANIFTGNPDRPWVEAIGIKDGRIAALGNNDQVKAACPEAEALDLPGRLVTPGLTDAHCHFVSLGLCLKMIDLTGLSSLDGFRNRIKAAAADARPGEWLIGRGWNHNQWTEKREPTKADLDDIIPDNPAMMVRACGHSVTVNSQALAAVGFSAETPDPPGGKIDRDGSGMPTGMLRNCRELVEEHIPENTKERMREAVLEAQEAALRAGLTGIHTIETLKEWQVFADLDAEGLLKLRVFHLLPPDELEKAADMGLKAGRGSDHLWVGTAKLFADGSLGAGTALLHEPYLDCAGECGMAYIEPEDMAEKIGLAYHHGFNVAIHAIGDRALTNALTAIAQARKAQPGPRRDRIEHVQLCRPQELALFKEMGVVASVQPVFVPTDWSTASTKWGLERCKNAYAWKTLLQEGLSLQFGSDAPVEPIAPIFGLQAAVTRRTTDGRPSEGWFPEQCLNLEESLAGFSKIAAWTSRREDHLGSIEASKWADLTVFSQDLAGIPPEDWPGVDVEMTIIGGRIAYQK